MSTTRKHIPQATREEVLDEFNHRCAICGADKPQLHHIDGDPSNNDPANLIPLCPNCHLTDQHHPTQQTEPEKLALFRQFKDPTILKPQFHPLFVRLRFLDSIEKDSDVDELGRLATELIELVEALEMGPFYSKRLKELIGKPEDVQWITLGDAASDDQRQLLQRGKDREFYEHLRQVRNQILALIVELLHFQSW